MNGIVEYNRSSEQLSSNFEFSKIFLLPDRLIKNPSSLLFNKGGWRRDAFIYLSRISVK